MAVSSVMEVVSFLCWFVRYCVNIFYVPIAFYIHFIHLFSLLYAHVQQFEPQPH